MRHPGAAGVRKAATPVERTLRMFFCGRPGHDAARSGDLYAANVY